MKRAHAVRLRVALAALTIAAVPAGAVGVPATAAGTAASNCATGWGSTAEAKNGDLWPTVKAVRTGRHACFDRIVIDVRGVRPAYSAQYKQNIHDAGTGRLVPVRGGAKLEIVLLVHELDANGHRAYTPRNPRELTNVAGYRTFRQVAAAGYSEETIRIGLGVRARLPFRTFVLEDTGSTFRLVVDVAHRW